MSRMLNISGRALSAILEKIRRLPEGKRKIIFWAALIVVSLGLISVYIINVQNDIRNFKSVNLKEKLKTPNFGEELKDWPKLEMPPESLEELKKLEEEIQKNEEENQTSTTQEEQSTSTK